MSRSLRTIMGIIAVLILHGAYAQDYVLTSDIKYGEAVNDTALTVELFLDMYQPQNVSAFGPAVILVHGGGWFGGDKDDDYIYNPMSQKFAEAGYRVFNINYRLLTAKKDGGPGYVLSAPDSAAADIFRALDFIKLHAEEYGVDTSKILIGGDSAGGSAVVNAAYKNDAGAGFLGVIDLWGGNAPDNLQELIDSQGGAVWDKAVWPYPIPENAPPTFILHGDADISVPIQTSYDFADSLLEAGIYRELHILTGAGHWAYDRLDDFMPMMLAFAEDVLAAEEAEGKLFFADNFNSLQRSNGIWDDYGRPGQWLTTYSADLGANGSGAVILTDHAAGTGLFTHRGKWKPNHRYKVSMQIKGTGDNAFPVVFHSARVKNIPNINYCDEIPTEAPWDTVTVSSVTTEWQVQEAEFLTELISDDETRFGISLWAFDARYLCLEGWTNTSATDNSIIDNFIILDLGEAGIGPVSVFDTPERKAPAIYLAGNELRNVNGIVSIFDTSGRLMIKKEAVSGVLNIASLNNGIYIVHSNNTATKVAKWN